MQAARYLLAEHQAGHAFSAIPGNCVPRDLNEAYATQDALHGLFESSLGPMVGYKVALTTRVMQQMVGFDEPIPGAVFESTVHTSGTRIAAADFNHLGMECELALHLAETLPAAQAPFDRNRVADAVCDVMAAFELVDDRSVDYRQFADNVLSFVADNAWNAGVVLGPAVSNWQGIDLASLTGTLTVNGNTAGTGEGRDVMGHPLDALAWLANNLAGRGHDLPAGALVMTGSIIATRFVNPGEQLEFELGSLPTVSVEIV